MKKILIWVIVFVLIYFLYNYSTVKIIKVTDLPPPDQVYESEELYQPISIHDERIEIPPRNFYYFDGWEFVTSNDTSCLNYTLTLKRIRDGYTVTRRVTQGRDKSIINRLSNCLVGNASGFYDTRVLNSRYFVFLTSDPGYVFFDRKTQKFLPYILQTENCIDSKLFVTKSGLVLIHDSVNDDCKFSEKLNEKESWHVAKYDGLDLSAPVSDLDVESVEQYRSKYSSF